MNTSRLDSSFKENSDKNIEKFIDNVRSEFDNVTYRHRLNLSRELKKLSLNSKNGENKSLQIGTDNEDRILDLELKISEDLEKYKAFFENRKNSLPKITYDEALPVAQKREEIIEAIRNNQVLIIAGETGSGKTTQIPKMCLEAGLGLHGLIGHTQPRRLAARAVSSRIALELGEELGHSVGYKVRFTDVSSDSCYIKLMTDGILLSETASDRLLLNYDCIIIDEAHERSLNIDFLLGYLKQLLVKRRDLKLIITSATINTERFSKHFDNAPVIEVSGRTYPVEVEYMPLGLQDTDEDDPECEVEELDLRNGILKAIKFLFKEHGRADTLVFLPGEREIMDIASFLKKAHLQSTLVLQQQSRTGSLLRIQLYAWFYAQTWLKPLLQYPVLNM